VNLFDMYSPVRSSRPPSLADFRADATRFRGHDVTVVERAPSD
jgi:hypothetical protein